MKKIGILLLILSICLFGVATIALDWETPAYAYEKDILSINAETIVQEIFGDKKIKKVEYLYGFNDSPDYV
ncbi:MAG: hypothetical protein J5781_06955 [Clostridia bacterium]|nr:hypothetical protein [Clostridia bacterium]